MGSLWTTWKKKQADKETRETRPFLSSTFFKTFASLWRSILRTGNLICISTTINTNQSSGYDTVKTIQEDQINRKCFSKSVISTLIFHINSLLLSYLKQHLHSRHEVRHLGKGSPRYQTGNDLHAGLVV